MLVPRWEYRQESGLTIEELNEIGQEGWELAGYAAAGNSPIRSFYVFKRPIYDAPEGKQVEEPDGQLSYLNNTPISHLIAEVDRLDTEDFAQSFPGNREKIEDLARNWRKFASIEKLKRLATCCLMANRDISV